MSGNTELESSPTTTISSSSYHMETDHEDDGSTSTAADTVAELIHMANTSVSNFHCAIDQHNTEKKELLEKKELALIDSRKREEEIDLEIKKVNSEIQKLLSFSSGLKNELRQLVTLRLELIRTIDQINNSDSDITSVSVAHLSFESQVSCLNEVAPSTLIGQEPIPSSALMNINDAEKHKVLLPKYLRYLEIKYALVKNAALNVITAKNDNVIIVDERLRPCDIVNNMQYKKSKVFIIQRSKLVDIVLCMWDRSTKTLEPLVSGDEEGGTYQTITNGSAVDLWGIIYNTPWVQEVKDNLTVVDAGSGLNMLCTIGAMLYGVKMAVGIELGKHKCKLAAQCQITLISAYDLPNVNVGCYNGDYSNPKNDYSGFRICFLWDRAFPSQDVLEFYKVLHNTIRGSVLLVHSTCYLRERMSYMEDYFSVEEGPRIPVSMKGKGAKDTMILLKLTRRDEVQSEYQNIELDKPIIQRALSDFSKTNRLVSYEKLIQECTIPRSRKRSLDSQSY